MYKELFKPLASAVREAWSLRLCTNPFSSGYPWVRAVLTALDDLR